MKKPIIRVVGVIRKALEPQKIRCPQFSYGYCEWCDRDSQDAQSCPHYLEYRVNEIERSERENAKG